MSTVLSPTIATINAIKISISGSLKSELPRDVLANSIAPLLISVNQWASQIPSMLDNSNNPASANLIFAIRKDLFIGPLFTHCVIGLPLVELPAPFQDFQIFIHKLIDAQKVDREKPASKVRSCPLLRSFIRFIPFILLGQAARSYNQVQSVCR